MIATGALAGANMAVAPAVSYPGSVAATVGKPGTSGDGLALVTATARSLPDLICDSTEAALPNIICT